MTDQELVRRWRRRAKNYRRWTGAATVEWMKKEKAATLEKCAKELEEQDDAD